MDYRFLPILSKMSSCLCNKSHSAQLDEDENDTDVNDNIKWALKLIISFNITPI